MATAGHFVRERIPIQNSASEVARQVLEVVSASPDTEIEADGPMTFRLTRRYRPSWATMTGFLVVPLFVRNTESCRLAVIEANNGSELLLEGTIEPDLHDHMLQLGRVPDAARVSTLGPRPVPQALSQSYAPSPAPQAAAVHQGANGSPKPNPFGPPPAQPPIDLHSRDPRWLDDQRMPTLLPREGEGEHVGLNGSSGSSTGLNGSPHGASQSAYQPSPQAPSQLNGQHSGQGFTVPAPTAPVASMDPAAQIPQPSSPRNTVLLSIDSGEQTELPALLIIGRAPSRGGGETNAELLTVNDPSLSVSKSHLTIELDDSGLWVTDRNSTNGSWIDEGRGALRPVPAQQRTQVPPGARVLIGERILTFSRT